jgi:uncharacterized membrane protein
MSKNYDLDERQLFIRGEAFKHGLLFMGLVILIDACLKDNNIILVEGMWGNILLIVATSTIIYTEMIFRNAINYEDKRMSFVLMLLGCVGLVLLIYGTIELLRAENPTNKSYFISKPIADLIMALLWFWIGSASLLKKHATKYEE